MSMFGTNAQSVNNVHDINNQIWNARQQISKLREEKPKRINNELRKNDDYKYVREHSAEIAKLRRANEQIIDRACAIVKEKNKTGFVLIARTPMVFMLYSSKYWGISSLHTMYDINAGKISLYEQRLKKIDGLTQRVKNHHDSIMHAEIDKYQLMIDSLLNEKMRLIR